MPDANCVRGVAQACARTSRVDDERTIAARLRERLASGWCELSAAELAELMYGEAATRKQALNRERHVRRELALIRCTYGARFVEVPCTYGRQTITIRRRIFTKQRQGVMADTLIKLGTSNAVPGTLDLRATISDDASAKARAPKIKPRRARAGTTNPGQVLPELALERGVFAAIQLRHGLEGIGAARWFLSLASSHASPDCARLAVRTLAERGTGETPVENHRGYLRGCFKRALEGAMLVDQGELWNAERAELAKDPLRTHNALCVSGVLAGRLRIAPDLYIDRDYVESLRSRAGPEPPIDLSEMGRDVPY